MAKKNKTNSQKSETENSNARVLIIVAFISAVATVIAAIIGIIPDIKSPQPTNIGQTSLPLAATTISPSINQTLTMTIIPLLFTDTPDLILTPTTIQILTVTPLPFEITDGKNIVMRLVPASDFIMGSEGGFEDERPPHIVHLDNYYIDVYEVTNAAYKQCVDVGACNPPLKLSSFNRQSYYGNTRYDNYPVLYVNWEMANAYCVDWRSGRLPTEAEWEKAAKGTDTRLYPWGNVFNGMFLNYCDTECDPNATGAAVEKDFTYNDGNSDTSPVGIYPNGKSPYGIYDMAGNVWEWVFDWYGKYDSALNNNPQGPTLGTQRILRGGSWGSDRNLIRVTNRRPLPSEAISSMPGSIGFRCAKDATP